MSFGMRLKELRTNRKITQQQLVDIINVSKVSISAYEHNSRKPTTETLKDIANYFGVTTDYLLGIKNNKIELSPEQLKVASHIDDTLSRHEMKMILSFIQHIKEYSHSK